jgi:cobalt/nickel transport system permease protein
MVGSLFIRSYERSERVYAAMLARGFDGTVRGLERARPSNSALLGFGLMLAGLLAFTLAALSGPSVS